MVWIVKSHRFPATFPWIFPFEPFFPHFSITFPAALESRLRHRLCLGHPRAAQHWRGALGVGAGEAVVPWQNHHFSGWDSNHQTWDGANGLQMALFYHVLPKTGDLTKNNGVIGDIMGINLMMTSRCDVTGMMGWTFSRSTVVWNLPRI